MSLAQGRLAILVRLRVTADVTARDGHLSHDLGLSTYTDFYLLFLILQLYPFRLITPSVPAGHTPPHAYAYMPLHLVPPRMSPLPVGAGTLRSRRAECGEPGQRHFQKPTSSTQHRGASCPTVALESGISCHLVSSLLPVCGLGSGVHGPLHAPRECDVRVPRGTHPHDLLSRLGSFPSLTVA